MKKIIKQIAEPEILAAYKKMVQDNNQLAAENPDVPKIKLDYYTLQSSYTNYFDPFREILLKEQGFICCYCMQRIGFNSFTKKMEFVSLVMKVEHYKPKDENKYPHLQLDYHNLIGSCFGDPEGIGKARQLRKPYTHCDTLKSSYDLKYVPNPSSTDFDAFSQGIAYEILGNEILILHRETLIVDELSNIKKSKLNLNEQNLCRDRYDTWFELCFNESQEIKPEEWNAIPERILELINEYNSLHPVEIEVIDRKGNISNQTYEVFLPFCEMIIYFLKEIKT